MTDLITVAEAAKLLGRPTRTVLDAATKGKLPYVTKLDGRTGAYLFDRATIVAIAAEEVTA